eukprot:m.85387 g.85387  ORF g.85387 m.85387 type:complete len:373 (-) comp14723_c0_seq1:1229-2347(-)
MEPAVSQDAVLLRSEPMPDDAVTVQGYDFNEGVDHDKLLGSFLRTGYQATNFGLAVEEVNRMLDWSLADVPVADNEDDDLKDEEARRKVKTKVFLGYTSNMVSAGVRETIRFLVQHKMVDVVVTTAGGIEEDFIKCMADTYLGDFALNGASLRRKGINRIGNLLVPNDNYVKFEEWMMPILDAMVKEQKEDGVIWTPSSMIRRLGKEIDDESSIYYWAYKNDIPVFCPALTDGSIGDMIYFHSFKNPGLILDIAGDIRGINSQAEFAKHTGMVIVGGGLIKHHICNANLMRNGADHAVFINTAQEFDGSDSGARPDEAVSWGKIRMDAKPVKVYGEASFLFPLLVAQTFAKRFHADKASEAAAASEATATAE